MVVETTTATQALQIMVVLAVAVKVEITAPLDNQELPTQVAVAVVQVETHLQQVERAVQDLLLFVILMLTHLRLLQQVLLRLQHQADTEFINGQVQVQ